MALKIDWKMLVVTSIFLGFFLGFYVDNTIYSKPRIETLSNQLSEQDTTIEGLIQELATLQTEHDVLTAVHDEFSENNVGASEYEELQSEANAMAQQITTLESQVELFTTSVEDLEDQLEEVQDDYDQLTLDHDRLQERFDEIYNPGYVAFSYNDLDINLTVTKFQYAGNTPIQGTVTVKHSNGDLFEGTFKLRITKVYISIGSPSDYYEIHGISDYYWSSAFVSGAGAYKLGIAELLDDVGEPAVPSTVLNSYYINIFMG